MIEYRDNVRCLTKSIKNFVKNDGHGDNEIYSIMRDVLSFGGPYIETHIMGDVTKDKIDYISIDATVDGMIKKDSQVEALLSDDVLNELHDAGFKIIVDSRHERILY